MRSHLQKIFNLKPQTISQRPPLINRRKIQAALKKEKVLRRGAVRKTNYQQLSGSSRRSPGLAPSSSSGAKTPNAWYVKNICSLNGADAGDKADAYEAFRLLLDNDFNGFGVEAFRRGCRIYLKSKQLNPGGSKECLRG